MSLPKIMVIEDNSSDIFLLRRALIATEGENFEMEVAADGERALRLIASRNGDKDLHPCVILLDMHLPKHDGIEILHAIRQNRALAEIPVLVTTDGVSPKEAEQLRAMGVDYRLKPKDLSEFAQLAADIMAICNGELVSS